jgi:hypothetical protein
MSRPLIFAYRNEIECDTIIHAQFNICVINNFSYYLIYIGYFHLFKSSMLNFFDLMVRVLIINLTNY